MSAVKRLLGCISGNQSFVDYFQKSLPSRQLKIEIHVYLKLLKGRDVK